MQVNLTEAQLDRLIEALRKSFKERSDQNLINYLQHIKNSNQISVELDEVPF